MGQSAPKLNPYEDKIVESVPDPADYEDKRDREAIEALKKLSPKKQLLVLKKLGVTPENPLSISEGMRSKLLSVVAEVAFGVTSENKGKTRMEISTPTGSGKHR
jgi:hypothetical protein